MYSFYTWLVHKSAQYFCTVLYITCAHCCACMLYSAVYYLWHKSCVPCCTLLEYRGVQIHESHPEKYTLRCKWRKKFILLLKFTPICLFGLDFITLGTVRNKGNMATANMITRNEFNKSKPVNKCNSIFKTCIVNIYICYCFPSVSFWSLQKKGQLIATRDSCK